MHCHKAILWLRKTSSKHSSPLNMTDFPLQIPPLKLEALCQFSVTGKGCVTPAHKMVCLNESDNSPLRVTYPLLN